MWLLEENKASKELVQLKLERSTSWRLDFAADDLYNPCGFFKIRCCHAQPDVHKIVPRAINLDQYPVWRELDSPQAEMTNVLLVVRFNVALVIIRVFELALDKRYGLSGSLASSLYSNKA